MGEYIRERETIALKSGSGDAQVTGSSGDENGVDWLLLSSLGILYRASRADVDCLEPHVPIIVAALTQCDHTRTARVACLCLAELSNSGPETVAPYEAAIVKTVERFDDAELTQAVWDISHNTFPIDIDAADDAAELRSQNPEYFETMAAVITDEEGWAGWWNGLMSWIRDVGVQKIVTTQMFWEMVSGYVYMLEETPDIADALAAEEHAETMIEIARAPEDPEHATIAAEALYLLARLRTAAVATHTDEVADLLDDADTSQGGETVIEYVLTALANVAGEQPAAVVDRVDAVADAFDPPAEATTETVETGVYVLSRLTPWPAQLASHFDLLVESLGHVDSPSAVDNGLRAVMSVAGPESDVDVRPHADALGETVGRLDDWSKPIRRLQATQRKYPELKLAIVEVLAGALEERETVEPAQTAQFRTALVGTADGIEPPVATARTCDLLGRVGSTVPSPDHGSDS
jgi:hypothetical protein